MDGWKLKRRAEDVQLEVRLSGLFDAQCVVLLRVLSSALFRYWADYREPAMALAVVREFAGYEVLQGRLEPLPTVG